MGADHSAILSLVNRGIIRSHSNRSHEKSVFAFRFELTGRAIDLTDHAAGLFRLRRALSQLSDVRKQE